MDEKYNWKLTDIFKNDEEFNNSKNIIEDKLNKIEEYKGKLCDSAENLYNCYKLYEEILMIFEKVYSYGMFKYHLNMADQEGIKKFKEVESLAADLDVKTSFIVPEITYSDENKVEEFFKEKEELSKYKRSIYEILEKKEHILSKEEEHLQKIPAIPYDFYSQHSFKIRNFFPSFRKKTCPLFTKSKSRKFYKNPALKIPIFIRTCVLFIKSYNSPNNQASVPCNFPDILFSHRSFHPARQTQEPTPD